MKKCSILILFFISQCCYAQSIITDSLKKDIQYQFMHRMYLEQMKDIPCYFTTCKSDSLDNIRANRFEDNFNYIKLLTKTYGFPDNKRIYTDWFIQDSLRREGKVFIYMTFIHILQTKPALIMNKEFASLLQEEQKKGNIDIKQYYDNSINLMKLQKLICLSEMPTVNEILLSWNIEPLAEHDFRRCE